MASTRVDAHQRVTKVWINHPVWYFNLDGDGRDSLCGHGDGWRQAMTEYEPADHCTIVDGRTMSADQRHTLCVQGPMDDPTLPPGMVRKMLTSAPILFDPRRNPARDERYARFGNAGGLDYVSPDVYLYLARGLGALVIDHPAAVRAIFAHPEILPVIDEPHTAGLDPWHGRPDLSAVVQSIRDGLARHGIAWQAARLEG